MSLNKKLLATLLLGGFVAPANASLIYNAFTHAGTDQVDYEVTIDHDTTNNEFDITYKVLSTSPNTVGKLTGIFFDMGPIDTVRLSDTNPPPAGTRGDPDTSDPYTAANLGLTNQSNPSLSSICGQAFGDINDVAGAGGCNSTLQLGTTIIDAVDYQGFLFDVGLAWKVNDLSSGSSGSFSIADIGLTLDDWGAIGLRGQATGSGAGGGSGSAKEFQLIGTPGGGGGPSAIPEPGMMALFGIGLVGMGLSQIRRKRKVS